MFRSVFGPSILSSGRPGKLRAKMSSSGQTSKKAAALAAVRVKRIKEKGLTTARSQASGRSVASRASTVTVLSDASFVDPPAEERQPLLPSLRGNAQGGSSGPKKEIQSDTGPGGPGTPKLVPPIQSLTPKSQGKKKGGGKKNDQTKNLELVNKWILDADMMMREMWSLHAISTVVLKLPEGGLDQTDQKQDTDEAMDGMDAINIIEVLDEQGQAYHQSVKAAKESGQVDPNFGPPAGWKLQGLIQFFVKNPQKVPEGAYDTIFAASEEMDNMTNLEIGDKFVHVFRNKRAYLNRDAKEMAGTKLYMKLKNQALEEALLKTLQAF